MIYFGKDNLKYRIINLLSDGPKHTLDIIQKINSNKYKLTKQAVYLAIRNLIKEEIITKYKTRVMLNQIWIDRLNEFVKEVDKNYLENYKGSSRSLNELDKLADNDKIVYFFSSLDRFDIYWNHIFSLIVKKTNAFSPLYIYNPHEWILLARVESEKYMYQWISRKKPLTCYAIGGKTEFDRSPREKYSSQKIEFSVGEKMGFSSNYYLAIIQNYLIETYLDKKLAAQIDTAYEKSKSEEEIVEKIKKLVGEKTKFKIVVSLNSEKAKRLKKKFHRIFLIPKNLREL